MFFVFFMIILELRVYMYIYFKNSMLGGILEMCYDVIVL